MLLYNKNARIKIFTINKFEQIVIFLGINHSAQWNIHIYCYVIFVQNADTVNLLQFMFLWLISQNLHNRSLSTIIYFITEMVTYNIYTKIAAHIALSKIVEYYMLLFVRNACNKNPLHLFSPIFSTLANDVKKGIVYSSMTSNQCLMYNIMIESLYFTVWRIFRL